MPTSSTIHRSDSLQSDGPVEATYVFTNRKGRRVEYTTILDHFDLTVEHIEDPIGYPDPYNEDVMCHPINPLVRIEGAELVRQENGKLGRAKYLD